MADPTPNPVEPSLPASVSVGWRHVWQIPLLACGVAAIGWATWFAIKTTPRVDRGAALLVAKEQLTKGEYEEALGTLNEQVMPFMSKNELTRDQIRDFHLLRARSLYFGQRELKISRQENHDAIVREYELAQTLSAELTIVDLGNLTRTQMARGDLDAALGRLAQIDPETAAGQGARTELYKELVDALLHEKPVRADVALTLVAELSDQPGLTDEDRIWALSRQTTLFVQQSLYEEAVNRILRVLPRLQDTATAQSQVGEVLLILGEAYLKLDQFGRAAEQIERAALLLGPAHERAPRALRLLGLVDQTTGGERLLVARERYSEVIQEYGNSNEVPRALLGLAEVESVLANTQAPGLLKDSIRHYGLAVDVLTGVQIELLREDEQGQAGGADGSHQNGAGVGAGEEGGGDPHEGGGHGAEPPGAAAGKKSESAEHAQPVRDGETHAPEHNQHSDHKQDASHDTSDGHSAAGHDSTAAGKGTPSEQFEVDQEFLRDVLASLGARFAEQFDKQDYPAALDFGEMAQRLTGIDNAPPEIILGLARTHRELAAEILRSGAAKNAQSGNISEDSATTLAKLDPATQREARTHLLRAGEYYRMHATDVVQTDDKGYGDSLWAAADMFDRAGDLPGSALAFEQFAADFPGDSRKPEAVFRLAEAQRARGDLEVAAALYRSLVSGEAGDSRLSGRFADASLVPLAETLLADNKSENDSEAEEVLDRVLRGDAGGTSTPQYRKALRVLGSYYYDSGRHERAIERLREYLDRSVELHSGGAAPAANGAGDVVTGDATPVADSDTLGLLYKLADAHRQSAAAIAAGFDAAMPDSRRRELEIARRERLVTAIGIFARVEEGLASLSRRTAIDDLRYRNSLLYRADCAFDLKDYDVAVRLYDQARERYPRDPASLIAMIQIVAALLEQGRTAEAVTANSRAKKFYESLPSAVWDDPTLPMTRKQWEQWLDVQTQLAGGGGEQPREPLPGEGP
jgi:tetratricopeptide (TPR) repeat protein